MKDCPYCAEKIQDAAKLCRYCHSEQPAAVQSKTPPPLPSSPVAPPKQNTARQLGGYAVEGVGLIFRWILSFALMALICVGINWCSHNFHHFWHKDEYKKLDSLDADLARGKSAITTSEADLDARRANLNQEKFDLQNQKKTIDDLKASMKRLSTGLDRTERTYPNGIPSECFNDYKSQVANYNGYVRQEKTLISNYNSSISNYNEDVNTYKQAYSAYSGQIASYNAKVGDANAISEKIGPTFSVIPVPRLGGGSRRSSR